ncbi:MAG: radical SAM protein [Mariprofundales bacterium]|nr:radical SAM protein [Mariprofundales bacterium]
MLTTTNHDRDEVGMRYVYPVVSRRAGGVSIGINLNPNNACNWRCCYCQVPNLTTGHAPAIDLALLGSEFAEMLHWVLHGDFLAQQVDEGMRQLCDIAISGNGEPTSSPQFAEVVALVLAAMAAAGVPETLPLRLITNGSYVGKAGVQQGLRMIASHHGEVWIKVDGGDGATIARTNGVHISPQQLRQQVEQAAGCCPTWIQSCMMLSPDGVSMSRQQVDAYLHLLSSLADSIQGVHLYVPARLSRQQQVRPPSAAWMADLVGQLRRLGVSVLLAPD